MRKWFAERPLTKAVVILGAGVLWFVDFVEQPDLMLVAKYVDISILLVAVSRI